MNVSLSPAAAEIIAQQLALGFTSADEVIEEALRRMQTEAQQKLDALKAAVELGAAQAENNQFSPRSFDQMIEAARNSSSLSMMSIKYRALKRESLLARNDDRQSQLHLSDVFS